MAGQSSGTGSMAAPLPPKILLAKPGLVSGGPAAVNKFSRGVATDEDATKLHSRIPSLNLLSDSWELHTDRLLPFLTDNTEFTVVGVIGPPGVGKSTIMNELYGFDGNSPGMLPPFSVQSEETRAMAKHCTTGIEPRVSAERLILLDTQPMFSPSLLADIMRPDGSSTVPVLSGEAHSADLAHELMSIQLGVLLSSICHIVLVVSEGVHNHAMWRLMSTVDQVKHGIPDPSSLISSQMPSTNLVFERDEVVGGEEYMAVPVFVHTMLQDREMSQLNILRIEKALTQNCGPASFIGEKGSPSRNLSTSVSEGTASRVPNLFLIPLKIKDDPLGSPYESYNCALRKLRDQIFSMKGASFTRAVSERDWLRNSAKIWEIVKKSPVIAEYGRMLQNLGIFRR